MLDHSRRPRRASCLRRVRESCRSKHRTFLSSASDLRAAARPQWRQLQVSASLRWSGDAPSARRCNVQNLCQLLIERDVPGVRCGNRAEGRTHADLHREAAAGGHRPFSRLHDRPRRLRPYAGARSGAERSRVPLWRSGADHRLRWHGAYVGGRLVAPASADRRRWSALTSRHGDRAGQPRPRRHASGYRALGGAPRCDRHLS